jgi:serine/threonine protein kinase
MRFTVFKNTNAAEPLRFRDLYQCRGILGHGQYGVVLLVLNNIEKELRALKIVYKSRLSEEELEILRTESEILQRLSATM